MQPQGKLQKKGIPTYLLKIMPSLFVTLQIGLLGLTFCFPSSRAGDSEVLRLLEVKAPTPLKALFSPTGTVEIASKRGDSLKHCRPYLASRIAGTSTWKEEYSIYQKVSETPQKLVIEAIFTCARATVHIECNDVGRIQISGSLEATSREALEIARFHYLDGELPTADTCLLSMRHYELPGRIIKADDALKAPLLSNWGWQRLDDPIHACSNIGISGDSGAYGKDWNSDGFFMGFTGPGSAFGEIGIRTRQKAPAFFLLFC